jgi:hypothetical protein
MSYPYPQDRHRDREEEGEQPYKDAKESFAQEQASLQTEAERFGETHQRTDQKPEQEAAERLAAVNRERRDGQSQEA